MSNKRPVILMAILLVLVGGCLSKPLWENIGSGIQADAPPLPGEDSISIPTIRQDDNGRWFADMDYYFTGKTKWANCTFTLLDVVDPMPAQASGADRSVAVPGKGWCGRLERGRHHLHFEMRLPPRGEASTTQGLSVQIAGGHPEVTLATRRVTQRIDWPDADTAQLQFETMGKSSDQIITLAAREIDVSTHSSVAHAKQLLEKVINQDPGADAAYVELARATMRTNWSSEGLHQAESLLQSALRIRPDSVNAKILMGYVQAHQHRYKEAQAAFTDASKSDPPNLWLWSNWGELLEMQGLALPAIEKYREALTRPPTHDTYDRARSFAYDHALALLESRRDFSAMAPLYKQRASEYGASGCGNAAYARFELLQAADAAAAIAIARLAIATQCDEQVSARDVLGMAFYSQWNANPESAAGQSALNQARVYLPVGARAFYLLAGNDRTLPAARRLTAIHESVDALDNQDMNALAYALTQHELQTAKRLIGLGARPDLPVGAAKMPAAFIPVANEDAEGIRLMQHSGIDYTTLRFQGTTAVEQARHLGRPELLKMLDPKSNAV